MQKSANKKERLYIADVFINRFFVLILLCFQIKEYTKKYLQIFKKVIKIFIFNGAIFIFNGATKGKIYF